MQDKLSRTIFKHRVLWSWTEDNFELIQALG